MSTLIVNIPLYKILAEKKDFNKGKEWVALCKDDNDSSQLLPIYGILNPFRTNGAFHKV